MMGLDLILLVIVIGFSIFLLLVVGGFIVYALGRRPRLNLPGAASPYQTLLELLKARYAGGEITSEDYEKIRRDLGS